MIYFGYSVDVMCGSVLFFRFCRCIYTEKMYYYHAFSVYNRIIFVAVLSIYALVLNAVGC